MPELSVPEWLRPMSQLEREKLAMVEDETRGKAVSMLRKQIGLARMQEQYQGLMSNGVDDLTARKTALLNNADFIFADNPQAVVNLQRNEEALAVKARAQSQLDNYRMNLANERAKANAETERHHTRLEEIAQDKVYQKEDATQIEPKVIDINGHQFLFNPKSGTSHELKQQLSQADSLKLKSLYKELDGIKEKMQMASGTRLADLQWKKYLLDKQIRAITVPGAEVKTESSPQTAAAPAVTTEPSPAQTQAVPKRTLRPGAVIMQKGKKYRFKGGDPADPDSYEEVE